jgi:hypothetical protein
VDLVCNSNLTFPFHGAWQVVGDSERGAGRGEGLPLQLCLHIPYDSHYNSALATARLLAPLHFPSCVRLPSQLCFAYGKTPSSVALSILCTTPITTVQDAAGVVHPVRGDGNQRYPEQLPDAKQRLPDKLPDAQHCTGLLRLTDLYRILVPF